jgi:hypothetical protein
MQCNSCGLHSENLREYSRAVDLGDYRKTIETLQLCPACRVINALNPRYVSSRMSQAKAIRCETIPGVLQPHAISAEA